MPTAACPYDYSRRLVQEQHMKVQVSARQEGPGSKVQGLGFIVQGLGFGFWVALFLCTPAVFPPFPLVGSVFFLL